MMVNNRVEHLLLSARPKVEVQEFGAQKIEKERGAQRKFCAPRFGQERLFKRVTLNLKTSLLYVVFFELR